MTNIIWLGESDDFPPTFMAMTEPNGLLAAGGDLSATRLLTAYSRGIFPWYSADQPILWWTPSPRTVFTPSEVHCSRSMKKFIARSQWHVQINSAFLSVIHACAAERGKGEGTWISEDIITAYNQLHQLGFAHSIEVYAGSTLVGGLYGIALGRMFFGESMFSLQSNASKFGLIVFSRWLEQEGFALMDCQVANPHLMSLGAKNMEREAFERTLDLNTSAALIDSMQPLWQLATKKTLSREGHLLP